MKQEDAYKSNNAYHKSKQFTDEYKLNKIKGGEK